MFQAIPAVGLTRLYTQGLEIANANRGVLFFFLNIVCELTNLSVR